jgi:hypothetical protein
MGFLCAALLVGARAPVVAATPLDALAVGDPLEAELRVLELYPESDLEGRVRLPHLATRPLQWFELEGGEAPIRPRNPVVALSLARLERAMGRNARAGFQPDPRFAPTPRVYAFSGPDDQRVELSLGLEGAGETLDGHSRYLNGSGAHARVALALDRWLVFSHLYAGQVDGARRFADPIVPGNDFVVHTEDTYLAYTGNDAAWCARLGRTRWHWGPGREASLVISGSAPAMTGFSLRARIAALRLDLITLNATLDEAAGEQLAAHRIEWQPIDRLRLGVTEAARYHAESWQPLYLAGVIPYVLVQRFHVQDSPDSLGVLRNNVVFAFDGSWRVAPGTRVYGEFMIDDLHARTNDNPNKFAWQLGWEGAGTAFGNRVTWGGEYTRVWRYVYTSFFGRAFALQGEPIGYPTGPDARRLVLFGTWDPRVEWQVFGHVATTDQGQNTIDAPFIPGSPKPDPGSFEGVVQHTREAVAGLRWWPAGGVDVALSGGYRWIDDAGHVRGANDGGAIGTIALRLVR